MSQVDIWKEGTLLYVEGTYEDMKEEVVQRGRKPCI